MYYLLAFCVLLFDIRHAGIQAQSAIWKFPSPNVAIQANRADSVLLDYTTTTSSTILRMWCSPSGGNQTLVSSFFVTSNGPFNYILATYGSDQTGFPLGCHAELASDPMGGGLDSPAAIIFSSNPAQAAKTISQIQGVASGSLVTTTLAGAVSTLVVTTSPSGSTLSTSSSSSTKTNSLSQSTASTPIPTPTPSPSNSTGSGGSSSITPASQASTSPPSPTSSSNTGAIVGGVIGGLALLSFVVLALLFLRRYRRNHTYPPPVSTDPEVSKPGFNLFGFYQKRGGVLSTANVHEKDGSHLSETHQVYEAPGHMMGNPAPYELPANSSHFT